jgi:hypothetical protein
MLFYLIADPDRGSHTKSKPGQTAFLHEKMFQIGNRQKIYKPTKMQKPFERQQTRLVNFGQFQMLLDPDPHCQYGPGSKVEQ